MSKISYRYKNCCKFALFFMVANEIQIYNALKEKLGDETAKELTQYIELKIKTEVAQETKGLATTEELLKTKVEILRWLFASWATLMATIIFGILKMK